MITSEQLQQHFPLADEIPAEHRLPGPVHQRRYLIDGELKSWKGPTHTVLSPICLRDAEGGLRQVELGSCPQGGEAYQRLARIEALHRRFADLEPPGDA